VATGRFPPGLCATRQRDKTMQTIVAKFRKFKTKTAQPHQQISIDYLQ
jgi:hypothetical protein